MEPTVVDEIRACTYRQLFHPISVVKSAKASRFSFADMVKETITVTDEPVKGASRCVIAKYLGPSTPQSLLLSNNASVTSSMFVTPRPIAFAATIGNSTISVRCLLRSVSVHVHWLLGLQEEQVQIHS